MAKGKKLQGVELNSGYFEWLEENETWYHVPEEKHPKYLDLVDKLIDVDDKTFDKLMDEIEETYDKYIIAEGIKSISGRKGTLYGPITQR